MHSKLSTFLLPGLIIFVCLFSFAAFFLITHQPDHAESQTRSSHPGAHHDEPKSDLIESSSIHITNKPIPDTNIDHATQAVSDSQDQAVAELFQGNEAEAETKPHEHDINFQLNGFTSTDFLVDGTVKSDIGEMAFNSVLLPSNEVKLTLRLNQPEMDDIELVAYFDLAYFRMELDGGNRILNKDHKKLLKLTSLNLQPRFTTQYQEYEIPEHALMMVQMLEYWSVSPEGFVHEKREIVSQ